MMKIIKLNLLIYFMFIFVIKSYLSIKKNQFNIAMFDIIWNIFYTYCIYIILFKILPSKKLKQYKTKK